MKKIKLKNLISQIFIKYGFSKSHANISAEALINAELVGAYGHGLSRLKMYCDRIKKKVINPRPKIRIKKIVNHAEIVIHANQQLQTAILMLLRLMQHRILALMTLEK